MRIEEKEKEEKAENQHLINAFKVFSEANMPIDSRDDLEQKSFNEVIKIAIEGDSEKFRAYKYKLSCKQYDQVMYIAAFKNHVAFVNEFISSEQLLRIYVETANFEQIRHRIEKCGDKPSMEDPKNSYIDLAINNLCTNSTIIMSIINYLWDKGEKITGDTLGYCIIRGDKEIFNNCLDKLGSKNNPASISLKHELLKDLHSFFTTNKEELITKYFRLHNNMIPKKPEISIKEAENKLAAFSKLIVQKIDELNGAMTASSSPKSSASSSSSSSSSSTLSKKPAKASQAKEGKEERVSPDTLLSAKLSKPAEDLKIDNPDEVSAKSKAALVKSITKNINNLIERFDDFQEYVRITYGDTPTSEQLKAATEVYFQ